MGCHGQPNKGRVRVGRSQRLATFHEDDELPWPLLLPVGSPLLGSAAQVCSDRTVLAGAYCQLNKLWALRPYQ